MEEKLSRRKKRLSKSYQDLKERKKRWQQRAFLFFMLLLIGSLSVCGYYFYEKKYGLSRERMDLSEYFKTEGSDVRILLNNAFVSDETRGITEDGNIYIPWSFVKSLNDRFYYDELEKELSYMLPLEIEIYRTEDSFNGGRPFIEKDSGIYLNIELIKKYTDIRYESDISGPQKRILIENNWNSYSESILKKNESVRVTGGVKSEILTDLRKGDRVRILEKMDKWTKVLAPGVFIGYVRNSSLSDIYEVKPESDYVEPEFTHIEMENGEKVLLGFHQVMTYDANSGLENLIEKAYPINSIAPTWFFITSSDGTIESHGSKEYTETAHERGLKVWPVLNNFDGGEVEEEVFLKDKNKRKKMEEDLLKFISDTGADGLNVDFELIPESLIEEYKCFLRELSVEFRKRGLVLSVDSYVPYDFNSYYDLEELGRIADYVIIMCYDEHYSGSEKGSVSSLGYVQYGIDRALMETDRERIISALPFYTRVWITDRDGKLRSEALGAEKALEWAERKGAEISWDNETFQNFATVQDGDLLKEAWLEDEESLGYKKDACLDMGIAGMAFWRLGQEKDSFWEVFDINKE